MGAFPGTVPIEEERCLRVTMVGYFRVTLGKFAQTAPKRLVGVVVAAFQVSNPLPPFGDFTQKKFPKKLFFALLVLTEMMLTVK